MCIRDSSRLRHAMTNRNPGFIVIAALAWACAAPSPNDISPARIIATEQTSGTNALLIAVSPVNEQVVWLSGSQGTWVRTIDGGTNWQSGRVTGADSLQFRDVHGVDASTAYLLSIGNGNQSRIYKTTDGGQHWALQFMNRDPAAFYDCMDFSHSNRVPPATLPSAQPQEGSFAASGTCLVPRPGGRGRAVASNPAHGRVLHTADYGRTWSVDTLPITTRAGSGPQSIGFRDDRNGFALGGGNAAQTNDVLAATTSDGGRHWTARSRPPLQTGVWGGVYVPGARRPSIVAVGPAGAVYSRDDGATWTPINAFNSVSYTHL